jgi:hypothetical protein
MTCFSSSWNELSKKTNKEVKQAFPLEVFLCSFFLGKFGAVAKALDMLAILHNLHYNLQLWRSVDF